MSRVNKALRRTCHLCSKQGKLFKNRLVRAKNRCALSQGFSNKGAGETLVKLSSGNKS